MAMFPSAPVYTLLYDKNKTLSRFEHRVRGTSVLDSWLVRKRHRWFLPLMPMAIWGMNLGREYDLIISDTAGYGKGITYNSKTTKHIAYCHTPLRYAWETADYVKAKFGNFVGPLAAAAVSPVAWYLRKWDYWAGQRPELLLANSKFIADKIAKHYERAAAVVYPPVDLDQFYAEPGLGTRNYYLAIGRLLHYKRFDLIIAAFRELRRPLLIVGDGPEEKKLKALARDAKNIYFAPFVASEAELRRLYQNARAVVFSHAEDFGLVLAEAQACGTPIVAYAIGGANEIVAGETAGVLYYQQEKTALVKAILTFEAMNFDGQKISQLAERFSRGNFEAGLRAAIRALGF